MAVLHHGLYNFTVFFFLVMWFYKWKNNHSKKKKNLITGDKGFHILLLLSDHMLMLCIA